MPKPDEPAMQPGPPRPDTGFQQWPAAASGGGVTLVVWMDNRNEPRGNDVYATRLGPAGEVLDRGGIPVARAPGGQSFPDVAFDGTSFLVVWEDTRHGAATDIYGARVTPAGRVLDADGLPISRGAGRQAAPAVAAAPGGGFLVVWQDGRDSPPDGAQNDIYGARVTGTGAVQDGDGFPISRAAGRQAAPAVVPVPAGFFVAWQDLRSGDSDLYGARVSPAGRVLDAEGRALSTAAKVQAFPTLVRGADRLLLAWTDQRDGEDDIYAAPLGLDGTVLQPREFAVSTERGDQAFPAGVWDGERFLLAWQDERGESSDIYGAHVDTAAHVLERAGIAICRVPSLKTFPRPLYDGERVLVLWQDFRNGHSDIFAGRLDARGAVIDPTGLLISSAAD